MMHHFRAAIEEALDDPRPLVPHAEVESHFAKRRAEHSAG
jgi:DNA-damage-inducible protein J